jgi:hypothetical protein
MPQPNDLSRSLVALDQNSTIIAVVELSQSSWLIAGVLPGVERQPCKKLEPNPERLLVLLHRWRDEAVRAGRTITRIALAFEAPPGVGAIMPQPDQMLSVTKAFQTPILVSSLGQLATSFGGFSPPAPQCTSAWPYRCGSRCQCRRSPPGFSFVFSLSNMIADTARSSNRDGQTS